MCLGFDEHAVEKEVAAGRREQGKNDVGQSWNNEPVAKVNCITPASPYFELLESHRLAAGDTDRTKNG